jgi:hypothetical protein
MNATMFFKPAPLTARIPTKRHEMPINLRPKQNIKPVVKDGQLLVSSPVLKDICVKG